MDDWQTIRRLGGVWAVDRADDGAPGAGEEEPEGGEAEGLAGLPAVGGIPDQGWGGDLVEGVDRLAAGGADL